MKVRPLSGRCAAVRDALLSHGWEGDLAQLTAGGIEPSAYHVTGVSADIVEAMLPVAARLGLELVTGDGWLMLAGARSRFGAFARPWMQPDPVRELSHAIGLVLPLEAPLQWRHAQGVLDIDGPLIVGIINVSPDSFSDGGDVRDIGSALHAAATLVGGGAAILDIGGESTRPGATPLAVADEHDRVIPVVAALRAQYPSMPLSVDTVHADTAEAALDAGASIVNDVTAGRHDPPLLRVVAARRAGLVLSHSRGPLGKLASYEYTDYQGDVTGGVVAELMAAVDAAQAAGVAADNIVIDPGFGFGKTAEQSLTLLHQLDALTQLGRPVLVGLSRKRFLGQATGRDVHDRDRATAAACALAHERGARLFRVHDPAAVRDALAVAAAVDRAPADRSQQMGSRAADTQ